MFISSQVRHLFSICHDSYALRTISSKTLTYQRNEFPFHYTSFVTWLILLIVTESEVEQGVIYQDPVKDKVIVYFRKFLDIDVHDNIACKCGPVEDGSIKRNLCFVYGYVEFHKKLDRIYDILFYLSNIFIYTTAMSAQVKTMFASLVVIPPPSLSLSVNII